MKKIMFNDRYGLTDAVLDGRKTMTRRQVPANWRLGKSRYYIGEIVAVAQSYKDAGYECIPYRDTDEYLWLLRDGKAVNGVSVTPICETNKMFTRADLMPHQIRITSIRIERLQDISDKDCLREGIMRREMSTCPASECPDTIMYAAPNMSPKKTPREAFAALIDKVSGRGTWESNPYVVVYRFELVK